MQLQGEPVIANHSALLLAVLGNCRSDNAFSQAFTLFHDVQSPLPAEPLSAHAFQGPLAFVVRVFSFSLFPHQIPPQLTLPNCSTPSA